MNKISVQVVDDHAVFRSGLKMLINSQKDMEAVGEAADAAGAVEVARACQPAVVVLDICMPGGSGLEAIREILAAAPHSRVLILSMHDDPTYLRSALEGGAAGYVAKRATDTELLTAIRTVARGQAYVNVSLVENLNPEKMGSAPPIAAPVQARLDSLSSRERDVLTSLALGYTNKEIANQFNLSVKSVETYRYRVSEKLGATGRADLVRFAMEAGLIGGAG